MRERERGNEGERGWRQWGREGRKRTEDRLKRLRTEKAWKVENWERVRVPVSDGCSSCLIDYHANAGLNTQTRMSLDCIPVGSNGGGMMSLNASLYPDCAASSGVDTGEPQFSVPPQGGGL